MSTKQNNLIIKKPNAYLVDGEDITVQKKNNTPQKRLSAQKYTFKRSFTKSLKNKAKTEKFLQPM